ncbi:vacuolar protein sorting-associated protein vps5 [Malassezia pachydermatis]|uniref:Vacuolar protein sorting-associated protein vps5 n=1 Tax=Malassezia pachydermatis TaxID=77020 RepID=A0A0M8MWI1_9BASI|nr:vacuolar protein sorting-associated protein vps5 [Malassezia pachydermatis]KOS15180.1 vacuolar protein sorting-associated protein vps5 [Malassezia pachydermatis]
MKVLVTGASGLLGRAVMTTCIDAGHEVTGVAWQRATDPLLRLDLTDTAAVEQLLMEVQPAVVLHTAAERRPDVVEKDPAASHALNVEAPRTLARVCSSLPTPAYLINVSTDYVFDGTSPPYRVTDACHPLNAYGQSKRDGELAVLEAASTGRATNLRVPVLYGKADNMNESAVNTLLAVVQHTDVPVRMDAHAVRYPTCVEDVARILEQLASLYAQHQTTSTDTAMPPTLHFSAKEAMTKYDMCLVLSRVWNQVCKASKAGTQHIEPIYDVDAQAATKRPVNCKMDTSELEALGLDLTCVSFETWWTAYAGELYARLAQEGHTAETDEAPHEETTSEAPATTKTDEVDEQAEPIAEVPAGTSTADEAAEQPEAPAEVQAEAATSAPASPSAPNDASSYGTPSPTSEAPTADVAEPPLSFRVSVSDPHRVGDPVTAHVVYTVRILSNAPWLSKPTLSILRRYSDFRWLHAALVSNHPGVIVPPIPEKVKLGRFAPDVVEFRRYALERALTKILHHPLLQKDEDLMLFLESTNLSADIHTRDAKKGRVITPDHKAYFGWSHALQQYRFHDHDDWFAHQLAYLDMLESRLKEVVACITTLSQRRQELASAQTQLYHALIALSSSNLSRSVSTCFAALAERKKQSADASLRLAEHEAHVLGLVVYEYERLAGSIRKSFAAREDVWQLWQRADEELGKLRSKQAKRPDEHLDAHMSLVTKAELASAAHRTRFEEVSRLCKTEMERFEREKVKEIREALDSYVHTFQAIQQESAEAWAHCESIVMRHVSASTAS